MKKTLVMSLLSFALMFTIVGCGNNDNSNNNQSSPIVEEKDIFDMVTDLSEVKEIHTEQQLEYLQYEGEYKTMPENLYPDGKKHISEPNPVNLEWEFDNPSGEITSYSVIYGQEKDLSDGYEVVGSEEPSIDLYNVFLGTNYFQIKANYDDGTCDVSKIKTFQVENNGPRNLKIDGMTNCRDMGGRLLANGSYLKQGLIYRTSAPVSWGGGQNVVPDKITEDGKEELFNHLGVKTEINVNGSGSNTIGVENYIGAYMDYDGGKHHLFRNGESIKLLFHTLSNEDNYPLFYHCRIGTDRTGVCGILINGLLGVDMNEIYRDYLFSNFGNIQTKRYIGEKAGEDNILKYIADIEKMPGDTYQEKTYNMLLSIGVPSDELDAVIDILTTTDKGYDNLKDQISVNGKGLTPSGVTASTTKLTDRSHPETYYVLDASSKSVSYDFSLDKDYNAKFYAYLGNTEASTTKDLAETIKVTIDGKDVNVVSQTFKEAGFGNCSNRMNYASVNITNKVLTKGAHKITISQIGNKVNIGGLTIFNSKEKIEEPVGHTVHSYVNVSDGESFKVMKCSVCDEAYLSRPSLQTGKWDKTGAEWIYKFSVGQDTSAKIQLCGMVASNGDKSLICGTGTATDDFDDANPGVERMSVYVNGTHFPVNTATYDELGIVGSSRVYFDLANINLKSGVNEIKISVPNGATFRIDLGGEVRVFVPQYVKGPAIPGEEPLGHTHEAAVTKVVKNSEGKDVIQSTCSCGEIVSASINFSDYSGEYTFDKVDPAYKLVTESPISWKIVAPKAGKVKIAFQMAMTSSGHSSEDLANKMSVKANGTEGKIICSGTYGDNGLQASTFDKYICVAEVDVVEGENTITLTHIYTVGYRLYYSGEVRIMY